MRRGAEQQMAGFVRQRRPRIVPMSIPEARHPRDPIGIERRQRSGRALVSTYAKPSVSPPVPWPAAIRAETSRSLARAGWLQSDGSGSGCRQGVAGDPRQLDARAVQDVSRNLSGRRRSCAGTPNTLVRITSVRTMAAAGMAPTVGPAGGCLNDARVTGR